MLFAYTLLGISSLFIIYQDVREQMIPLSGMIIFGIATFVYQLSDPNPEGIWAAAIIAFLFATCQIIFYGIKQERVMGFGDLILSPLCGLWLYFSELSIFFLATGFFALLIGLFWRSQWGMRTFPMAPALLMGLGVVFLIRCFFTMSEI